MSQTASARQLYDEAEKKANSSGGFLNSIFGGGSYALEEAADLYIRAANGYRIAKDGKAAGQAFEKAAETQRKTDAREDVANTLVDAYKAYRQTSPEDAVRVLCEAIDMFMMRGQFRRAANYEMDIGGVYETDIKDLNKSVEAYDRAGTLYSEDQAEALSNKAYLKVADLSALNGNMSCAIDNFERVARQSLNSNLSKWSVKEYFIKGIFCYLCRGDSISTSKALEKYVEWDPTFASTKEYGYLADFIEAAEAGDEQAFTDKLCEYDQFNKMDQWKVSISLKIKEKLHQADDDLL